LKKEVTSLEECITYERIEQRCRKAIDSLKDQLEDKVRNAVVLDFS
jgi:hypothetical protein